MRCMKVCSRDSAHRNCKFIQTSGVVPKTLLSEGLRKLYLADRVVAERKKRRATA